MYIESEKLNELKSLSKEVFGSASRYQKILDKGTTELVTTKTTEVVPGVDGAEDTTREIQVPVLAKNGTKQYKQKYYTPDECLALLRTMKVKRDELLAMIKKQQEEQAAKAAEAEQQRKINEDLAGSALT